MAGGGLDPGKDEQGEPSACSGMTAMLGGGGAVKSLSHVRFFATPWTAARYAS